MAAKDGVISWWSGCQPTVYRAMCLNVGMLAMYDQSKDFTVKKVSFPKSIFVKSICPAIRATHTHHKQSIILVFYSAEIGPPQPHTPTEKHPKCLMTKIKHLPHASGANGGVYASNWSENAVCEGKPMEY